MNIIDIYEHHDEKQAWFISLYVKKAQQNLVFFELIHK